MSQSRLAREKKTIAAMVRIYCQHHHKSKSHLCENCQALFDYANKRLQKCPFQEDKPTCAHCVVHCYKPVMRDKVKTVMRFAGPRMIYRHPVLALFHLLDGRKKQQEKKCSVENQ